MKKKLVLFGLTLFCCMAIFGPLHAADKPRVLKVAAPWAGKGIDLDKSGFIYSRMGCIEMLTQADADGNISGLLAESWQVSADGRTWTFRLKPDILFHDGTALDAEAAALSLNTALQNNGEICRAKVEEIAPAGSMSLIIRTSEPFSPLPAYLAHYSGGIVSKASFDKNGKIRNIYGTGEYILTENQQGLLFKFEANPRYWDGKPGIQFAEYHAVPQGETRGFMIKSGQVDMALTLSPTDAEQLKKMDQVTVHTLSIPRSRLILLNTRQPFFSDIRVRQAISLAIDRAGIASALLKNPATAATQLLPETVSMWHDPHLAPLSHHPEKAAALLAQAGWTKGPDGILVKNGVRFEFNLLTYSARPMLPPIADAVQHQLGKLGIKMVIQLGESSLIPEKNTEGSLHAALIGRNFGQIPNAFGTIYGDFGPNPGTWGAMGWQSEKLNHLLTQYLETFDQEPARVIGRGILAVLQEELPVIPVSWYDHIVAYSNDLEGVDIDPFEIRSYLKGVRWKE